VRHLIARLEREQIDYETVEADRVVNAIWWADPRTIVDMPAVRRSNAHCHDLSHGFIDPIAGYSQFGVLATVEPGNRTQILICGVAVNANSIYFDAMWKLYKRVFGLIIRPKRLLVISDEDAAFLKSTRECMPGALQKICDWHKGRNVGKGRKSLGSLRIKVVSVTGPVEWIKVAGSEDVFVAPRGGMHHDEEEVEEEEEDE
jgi:hypothetical protein